jgi:hypothetical protein
MRNEWALDFNFWRISTLKALTIRLRAIKPASMTKSVLVKYD